MRCRNKKLHVVQNIPSPYRVHMFSVMNRILQDNNVEFMVHFMSSGHKERPDSWRDPEIPFPHRYWPDSGFKTFHFNPRLISTVLGENPDWLLLGSTFDTFTSAVLSVFAKSIKVAWSEGNVQTTGKMGGSVGKYKRYIFSKCRYIAVPGESGRQYVGLHQQRTKKRMPEVVFLPNIVDETRFKLREEWDVAEIQQARGFMGVEDFQKKICLCPARLEWFKGLMEFVERVTPEMLCGWKIVIMGEGSLKHDLLNLIKRKDLSDNIIITDYVPYEQMPVLYAASDLFLLPSFYDPNPLSVVEAMHSGLPLLLSDKTGNCIEAVEDEVNGWRLCMNDAEAYTRSLEAAFNSGSSLLVKMGNKSKEKADKFWSSHSAIANFLGSVGVI